MKVKNCQKSKYTVNVFFFTSCLKHRRKVNVSFAILFTEDCYVIHIP